MRLAHPAWPRFLPRDLVLGLATLGPIGRRLPAPGTWGSLAGLLYFAVFFYRTSIGGILIASAIGAYLAVVFCGEAELRLRKKDPGEIILDEFIVMPNHVHGVLFIDGERARHASPLQHGPTLGVIVGAYKSATTRQINQARGTPGAILWQRNYYEHVIRNDISLAEIRQYIANNPLQWAMDKYFTPGN